MTRRPPITGSKAHRAWKCPPSVVIPPTTDEDLEARAEPARGKGKVVHAYLQTVRELGIEAALAAAPAEHQLLLSAIDIDALPTHLSTEMAFRLNWRTGKAIHLGNDLDRDYGRAAAALGLLPDADQRFEIDLSIDVGGINENHPTRGRVGFCGDYKTGHQRYPMPDRFAQTLLGGLCIRSFFDVDQVVLQLVHVHDDGDHHTSTSIVDDWDLEAFRAEYAASRDLIAHAESEFSLGHPLALHEGEWCKYCPALKNCAAKTGMVRAMPAELVVLGIRPGEWETLEAGDEKNAAKMGIKIDMKVITVAKAAAAWMSVERIEEALARIKDEICRLGWVQPIPLPDGRVIEPYKTKKRELDGRVAARVLEAHYGREAALSAMDVSVTIGALEKVVGSAVNTANVDRKQKNLPRLMLKTRKGDGEVDKLMKEIELSGGVGEHTTEACRPHKPKAVK
jgi:hypothetical protein